MIIQEVLTTAISQLNAKGISSAILDAQLLLAHTLHCSRSNLIGHTHTPITHDQNTLFQALIAKRCTHIPIAYITGKKEFWSQTLTVTPDVLIPRPDTEILVETVLSHLHDHTLHYNIADICTGSGAIACALASELSNAHFILSDISSSALCIAEKNIASQTENYQCIQGHLLTPLMISCPYDIITANPPYIDIDDYHSLSPDIHHEPKVALVSDKHGLDFIYQIILDAPNYLQPKGAVLIEIGDNQKEDALNFAIQTMTYTSVTCIDDLSGAPRALYLTV